MASVKPAAWEVPEEPQALSLPAYRAWRQRIARHREHLAAAACHVTDIDQIEREVSDLERAAAGHKHSRAAQKQREEEKLRRDNARLVQKLCDVARQSEKRQVAIAGSAAVRRQASPDSKAANILRVNPSKHKRQQAIAADNLSLLHRLETARSVVPSASEMRHDACRHAAIAARMSRFRKPARPPGMTPRKPRRGLVDKAGRMYLLPQAAEEPQPALASGDSSHGMHSAAQEGSEVAAAAAYAAAAVHAEVAMEEETDEVKEDARQAEDVDEAGSANAVVGTGAPGESAKAEEAAEEEEDEEEYEEEYEDEYEDEFADDDEDEEEEDEDEEEDDEEEDAAEGSANAMEKDQDDEESEDKETSYDANAVGPDEVAASEPEGSSAAADSARETARATAQAAVQQWVLTASSQTSFGNPAGNLSASSNFAPPELGDKAAADQKGELTAQTQPASEEDSQKLNAFAADPQHNPLEHALADNAATGTSRSSSRTSKPADPESLNQSQSNPERAASRSPSPTPSGSSRGRSKSPTQAADRSRSASRSPSPSRSASSRSRSRSPSQASRSRSASRSPSASRSAASQSGRSRSPSPAQASEASRSRSPSQSAGTRSASPASSQRSRSRSPPPAEAGARSASPSRSPSPARSAASQTPSLSRQQMVPDLKAADGPSQQDGTTGNVGTRNGGAAMGADRSC